MYKYYVVLHMTSNDWVVYKWIKSKIMGKNLTLTFHFVMKAGCYLLLMLRGYTLLLYKHQWNTRWAFAWKHDIFTRQNIMLFSHVKNHCCYGYIINRAFRRIKLFQWNGLVFPWCLYNKINNRTLHGHLEVQNFSSRVENISLVCCAHSWNIFQHLIYFCNKGIVSKI